MSEHLPGNLPESHDVGDIDNNTIKLLTSLFDETLDADSKIAALENDYGLPLTREIEKEVTEMCTYATSMEKKVWRKVYALLLIA